LNYIRDNNHQFEINTKLSNGNIQYPQLFNVWRDTGKFISELYSSALEYQIKPSGKLLLQVGGAYHYFKPTVYDSEPLRNLVSTVNPSSTAQFDPMFIAMLSIADNLNLHFGISKKSRFPTLKELYSLHSGGNPELQTSKTITSEIGVEYSKNKLKTNAAVFFDDIKDYIQQNSITKAYENAGKTKIRGFESVATYFINGSDYFKTNYTYISIRNKLTNAPLTGRPKHKLYAGLSKKLWYESTAFISLTYTGEQYVSTGAVGGFTLYNLDLTKRITMSGKADLDIFFNCKNIFDKDYYDGAGPSEGRCYVCGVKAVF